MVGAGGGERGRSLRATITKKTEEKINSGQPLGRGLFFLGFFFGGGLFCFEMLRWCGFSTVREMENPQKKRSISLFILLFFLLPVLIISFFFLCSSRSPWVVCPDWRRFFYCRFVSFPYSVLFVFLCVFSIVFFCEGTKRKFPTGTMSSFLFSVKLGKSKNTRKCFKTNTRGSQNSNPIDENFPSKIKKNLKKGNKNRHTKKTRPTPQRPNSKCVRGQRRGGGARGAGLGNLINV